MNLLPFTGIFFSLPIPGIPSRQDGFANGKMRERRLRHARCHHNIRHLARVSGIAARPRRNFPVPSFSTAAESLRQRLIRHPRAFCSARKAACRAAPTRSFIARAVPNMSTTRYLLDRPDADPALRGPCGWSRRSETPVAGRPCRDH